MTADDAAPVRVALTSVGTPLSVALSRALREGHAGLRAHVIGLDADPAANGAHACDDFHVVPRTDAAGFADAITSLVRDRGVAAIIPQTTNDLMPLDAIREDLARAGAILIGPSAKCAATADSKLATYELGESIGVPVPAFGRAADPATLVDVARSLGYPQRDICVKPVHSSGSRGFRIISAATDRRAQLLHGRPDFLHLTLEDLLETLGDGAFDLVVMERIEAEERTVDGYARDGVVVAMHAKTREIATSGLAMRFRVIEAPDLVGHAATLVAELGLHGFFNIQFIGDRLLEVNPRISTIIRQPTFNLPWIGLADALGIDLGERPVPCPGWTAVRYYDQVDIPPA